MICSVKTFAPGDPGKPGAPAGPTGPCREIKKESSDQRQQIKEKSTARNGHIAVIMIHTGGPAGPGKPSFPRAP